MTYKELVDVLLKLSEEQLDMIVTIQFCDEFYPASLVINEDDDVLDKNHPIISNHEMSSKRQIK